MDVGISSTVEVLSATRVVKKDPKFPSKKRRRIDDFQGWETRRSTGELVKKTRRIDADAGTYHEHVETRDGTVIHHHEEPLKNHVGHGSDKRTKGPSSDDLD